MSFSRFQKYASSAAIAALFVSFIAQASPLPKPPEDYFGDYGYCALVLERSRLSETFIEVGPEQCSQALSPCSTFKIPNALIGLQTGVVTGPDDLKTWDGKVRSPRGQQPGPHPRKRHSQCPSSGISRRWPGMSALSACQRGWESWNTATRTSAAGSTVSGWPAA